MGYRVFDTEMNQWIKDDVYLSPDGELFLIERSMLGKAKKLILLEPDRFVYHNDIGLYDKENNLIFVGDYIKAEISEDRTVIGLVVFAEELSAYIILCDETNEFFTLGSEVCQLITKIGNVFDGYEVDIEEIEKPEEDEENE